MSNDEIRKHIEAAARRGSPDRAGIASRMLRTCWPGGPDDRTRPAARAWVSRWRPTSAGAALPTCSCGSGHCTVCN